ncbi:MAG: Bug family tripartite tricarboxylate transporter substrate binding protein [Rhodoferax sp.]
MKRSLFIQTLVAACAATTVGSALAQAWPSRPVKLVLGAPPGTAPDTAARIVGEKLSALWGQPVLIDNKPGAGGMIAMNAVREATDSHTFMFAHAGAVLVTPKILKAAKYDPVADFVTLGIVADSPMMIVANNESGEKNMADMVKSAQAKPGAFVIGSTEKATLPYLVGESIADATGTKFQHVPFNQPAQAIAALVKGDLHYYVDGIAPILPLVRAGRMKAVAVTTAQRLPGLEDIPLAQEVLPGFVAVGWFSLLGPKSMPTDAATRVNTDLNAVLRMPDVGGKMRDIAMFPSPKNLADSNAFMKTEVERWAAVIKKVGLEPQ